MPRISAESPELNGQVFELTGAKLTVGRAADNDIHIQNPSVSSHHGEFRFEGGDYRVVDMNSTNGTRINDERVTEAILRNGDTLMIGHMLFRYVSENVLSAPPIPEQSEILEFGTQAGGRPANFVNLAPFAKPKGDGASVPLVVLVMIFVALGAVGFCAYKIFA